MSNEQEPDIKLSPLVADIFTAMFTQSAATTNAVLEDKERTIAELKADYVALWEAVERIAVKTDSASLERLLDATDWKFRLALRHEAAG